jgi:hypothetical protein
VVRQPRDTVAREHVGKCRHHVGGTNQLDVWTKRHVLTFDYARCYKRGREALK